LRLVSSAVGFSIVAPFAVGLHESGAASMRLTKLYSRELGIQHGIRAYFFSSEIPRCLGRIPFWGAIAPQRGNLISPDFSASTAGIG